MSLINAGSVLGGREAADIKAQIAAKLNTSDAPATVRDTALTGLSTATATAVTAGDTVLVAAGKLQGQASANATAIADKLNTADAPAAVRDTPLTGLSTASATPITSTDSVLSAAGKLQAQIAAKLNTVDAPTTVRDTALTGLSTATATAITAADTVLVAAGKLQAQIYQAPKTLITSTEPVELLSGVTAPTAIPQFMTFTPDSDGTYILTIDFLMGDKSATNGVFPQFFIGSVLVTGGTTYVSGSVSQPQQCQAEFKVVKSGTSYRVYAWCKSHPVGNTLTLADAVLTQTATQAGSPVLGFNVRPAGSSTITSLVVQNVTLTKL